MYTFEAVTLGQLFYKGIESWKNRKLKEHKGNIFKNKKNKVNQNSKAKTRWWIENREDCNRDLHTEEINITVCKDAITKVLGSVTKINLINGRAKQSDR